MGQLVVQVAATRQEHSCGNLELRERIKALEHYTEQLKADHPSRTSVASCVKAAARALEKGESPRSSDALSPSSACSNSGGLRWRQERGRWSRENSLTVTPVKPDSGGTTGTAVEAVKMEDKLEQFIMREVAKEAKAAISRIESAQEQLQNESREIIA